MEPAIGQVAYCFRQRSLIIRTTAVNSQEGSSLLAVSSGWRTAALLVSLVVVPLGLVPGAAAHVESANAPQGSAGIARATAATFDEWHYYDESIDPAVPAGSYVLWYRGSGAPTGPFAYSSECLSGYCLWWNANPANATSSVREGYELMRLVRRGRMVQKVNQCFDSPAWEVCYARYQTPYEFSLPEPPPEQDFGNCGQGTHGVSASECMNDPVNSAIGAFLATATDLELPGLGVPFRFRRSYTSADTTVGRLGPGWVDSLGAALTIDPNGNVIVRGEDGQQLVYTRQPDLSYRGAAGARSTLRAVMGGYELTRLDQVRYRFDSSGRLTSMRDRNAHGLSLAYIDGRLTSVTDAAGRLHTFSYNDAGLLAGIQLSDGRAVSYAYTNGYLTSVRDVRGGTTSYRYDAAGRLDQITDANGHLEVRNTYGNDGRVVEQLDATGNRTTFAWDVFTQTATATDARGKVWKDVYSGGVLQRRIDPLGKTTVYTFDSSLNVTGISDPRGNTTTMSYDSRGNLLTRTAPPPFSYRQTYTYDAANNVLTAVDGRNITTTFGYDGAGNLTSVSRAGTTLVQLARDPFSKLVTSSTDARAKATTYGYDAAANLTSITTPLGNKTTIAYDVSARPSAVVEPRGNEAGANPAEYRTTFAWNAADLATSITDPLGNATTFVYDGIGNVTSVTDAKAHTTAYAYDAADRLLTVTAPGAAVTSYAYDGIGNMTRKTDPNAHVTTYTYDDAGRLATVTDPLLRVWTYAHDANGNVTRVDLPGGGSVVRAFDVLNRLMSIDYSDTTPDVQFGYDANSNRASLTDGVGSAAYTYDNFDRLLSLTRGTDTFSYAYDAAGNVTQRTYQGSVTATYSYDDDGRLDFVTGFGAETKFAYDAAGRVTRKTLPAANGYVETRTYDRVGRTTEVRHEKAGTPLSFFQYAYDPVGNPLSVAMHDGTTTYAYDVRDQLTEACFTTGCSSFVRYAYDAVGNRLSETRPDGTTSYAYDVADQLTSQSGVGGDVTYAYDPRGNQTQAGSRTFGWDLTNRLASTTDKGTTVTYTYDGDGARRQASGAGSTTNFLWDSNLSLPQLALERDGAGNVLRSYIHGHGPLAMQAGAQTSYFHRDALGSVANVTSATGALQWTYRYEPFGAPLLETKNDPGAPANPIRFAGEFLDGTGLYHLRARQFDPKTGRFLGVDPARSSISEPHISTYVYVANRPTSLIDPSGLGPIVPGGGSGGSGGGGAGGGQPGLACAICTVGQAVVVGGGAVSAGAGRLAGAADAVARAVLATASTGAAAATLVLAIPFLMAGDSAQGDESADDEAEQAELLRKGAELLGRGHSDAGRQRWLEWWRTLTDRQKRLYNRGDGDKPRKRN